MESSPLLPNADDTFMFVAFKLFQDAVGFYKRIYKNTCILMKNILLTSMQLKFSIVYFASSLVEHSLKNAKIN